MSALPSDSLIRQQVIEHLMRGIMRYDAEFRREELTSREALTMVRLFRAFDPTPMLDRPGGHLAVQESPFKNTEDLK